MQLNITNDTNKDYDIDYDYDPKYSTGFSEDNERGALVYMYVVTYCLIMLLGLPLHTLVICTITCKMKKTAAVIVFLGLSVTDLVVVLLLPLRVVSAWEDFTWPFGAALCKTCSYLMFVNMHSSALLLALLSAIRSLSGKALRICCSPSASTGAVAVSLLAGAVLSIPSLLERDSRDTSRGAVCRDTYAPRGKEAKAIAVVRFLSGWLCPFCVAFVCSCLVSMRRNVGQIKAPKAYAVIRVMIVAYFLCWLPYHVFVFFKLYVAELPESLLTVGLPVATALSFLNSCINPIIYIVMGGSADMSWMAEPSEGAPEAQAEDAHSLQNAKRRDSEEDDS